MQGFFRYYDSPRSGKASRRRDGEATAKAVRTARLREDPERVRERILVAFSAKAKRSGIRAVVMGELASELRVSPMTLYKHFTSKNDLVSAMVDAWARELAAIDALDLVQVDDRSAALERLLAWARRLDREPRERLARVLPGSAPRPPRLLGALPRADRRTQAGRGAAARAVPASGAEPQRGPADARPRGHGGRGSALRGAPGRVATRGGTHRGVDLGRRRAAPGAEAPRAADPRRPADPPVARARHGARALKRCLRPAIARLDCYSRRDEPEHDPRGPVLCAHPPGHARVPRVAEGGSRAGRSTRRCEPRSDSEGRGGRRSDRAAGRGAGVPADHRDRRPQGDGARRASR